MDNKEKKERVGNCPRCGNPIYEVSQFVKTLWISKPFGCWRGYPFQLFGNPKVERSCQCFKGETE